MNYGYKPDIDNRFLTDILFDLRELAHKYVLIDIKQRALLLDAMYQTNHYVIPKYIFKLKKDCLI